MSDGKKRRQATLFDFGKGSRKRKRKRPDVAAMPVEDVDRPMEETRDIDGHAGEHERDDAVMEEEGEGEDPGVVKSLWMAIHDAITEGALDRVRCLMAEPLPPALIRAPHPGDEEEEGDGLTLLMQACRCQMRPAVDMLLGRCAHVNASDDNGDRALHYAARAASGADALMIARALLAAGASRRLRNHAGRIPADVVAAAEVPEDFRALLTGDTPTVYEAAIHGEVAALERYLRGDPELCGPHFRYIADHRDCAGRTLAQMVQADAPEKSDVMRTMEVLLRWEAQCKDA